MFNEPSVENYLHLVDEKPNEQGVRITVRADFLVLWLVRNPIAFRKLVVAVA